MKYDYKKALKVLSQRNDRFHVIFLDPPYNQGFIKESLELIVELDLLDENGMIICETDVDYDFDQLAIPSLTVNKIKKFKTNKFTFIEMD